MSDWTNVAMGLDFQYELSKKISGKAEINSICSYVFSRPYVIELTNERQILFKIMRYYDNPIEYCYALVKTNKDFEISSIQCYRQKKQFIPLPPDSHD